MDEQHLGWDDRHNRYTKSDCDASRYLLTDRGMLVRLLWNLGYARAQNAGPLCARLL